MLLGSCSGGDAAQVQSSAARQRTTFCHLMIYCMPTMQIRY